MQEDEARRIFRFNDGTKDRCADPLMIDLKRRRASSAIDYEIEMRNFFGPEWLPDWRFKKQLPDGITEDTAREADNRQAEAEEKLLPVWYAAFGCQPIDDEGNGTTALEIIRIQTEFSEFEADVKKNTDVLPSESPSTDQIPPSISPIRKPSTVSRSTESTSLRSGPFPSAGE
jgi:hypothetical protein